MPESHSHLVAEEVIRTIPAVMRMLAAELRKQHIQLMPAQLATLAALAERSYNLSELAELSGVSLPTMSSAISHMVAQGWVQRQRAPHDRRMILLELTPDGRALLTQLLQHIVSYVVTLLAPLSPAELTTIQNGLTALQKVFPPLEPLPKG